MSAVIIDDQFASIVDKLSTATDPATRARTFDTNMDLMVFAAMIGWDSGRGPAEAEKRSGLEINDATFENRRFDGAVYLTALQHQRSGEILRDTNDVECWRIFEGYARTGFAIIDQWLMDNPSDASGVDTLIAAMKRRAVALRESARTSVADVDSPEIGRF